jgi:hypothetical protein
MHIIEVTGLVYDRHIDFGNNTGLMSLELKYLLVAGFQNDIYEPYCLFERAS